LHEALDTTTPGGRLVFHVFAALGEFIREMIVQGTREGLDAARARGTRLGRPPAMTTEQIQHARDPLGKSDNTVSSIARLLGVSRTTIYKYVPELRSPELPSTSTPLELSAARSTGGTADQLLPMPGPLKSAACPTCGHRPSSKHELQLHREGLETVWLLPDPVQPGAAVIERWYCERCQPHQARIIMCGLCSSTVMLGGQLANGELEHLPAAAVLWLASRGWIRAADQWTCGDHS
jgi:hypothetical protein